MSLYSLEPAQAFDKTRLPFFDGFLAEEPQSTKLSPKESGPLPSACGAAPRPARKYSSADEALPKSIPRRKPLPAWRPRA